MSASIGNGVDSNTKQQNPTLLNFPTTSRPFKIQKLQIPAPSQMFFESLPNNPYGEGTSANYQPHNQEIPEPAQNQNNQDQEDANIEENNSDPFCYYQDIHVQDSIDQCNHNLIGKILTDKSISSQVLYSSLSGIWCNPTGLKIHELEGKLLQIKMDKEEDIHRILKGNPWIIRNCWLIVHNWNMNLDITTLNFT